MMDQGRIALYIRCLQGDWTGFQYADRTVVENPAIRPSVSVTEDKDGIRDYVPRWFMFQRLAEAIMAMSLELYQYDDD